MSVAHDRFDAAATYQLAIEASPTGVLVMDAEGTIHLVNAELERQIRLRARGTPRAARRPAGAEAATTGVEPTCQQFGDAHARAAGWAAVASCSVGGRTAQPSPWRSA